MKLVKDVNKERKITLEFTEIELIILLIGYGGTTAHKREEDYQIVFNNVMPNHIAFINENNDLYEFLYEIIINPTDVLMQMCDSNQL